MLIARGRKVLRSLAVTRHGIGARLLMGVLVFSAFVTLILTALQLYIDYRREMSALELRLNQIGESYLGSLAEGLWNLDENQLRLQLSGILRLPDIRAVEMKASRPLTLIGLRRAAQRVIETGICPADLHQEIVGPAQRDQPALHCLLAVLDTGRRTKALGSDRADGRQSVLDAMVKFPKDQLL